MILNVYYNDTSKLVSLQTKKKLGDTTVPVGTVGKMVSSRTKQSGYCCIFAVPFAGIEAMVNPVTFLDFGMSATPNHIQQEFVVPNNFIMTLYTIVCVSN